MKNIQEGIKVCKLIPFTATKINAKREEVTQKKAVMTR